VTGTRVGARDFPSAFSIARATASASPPRRDSGPLVDLAGGFGHGGVELGVGAGLVHPAGRGGAELGPDQPGLDADDVDPEPADLHPQRVGDGLDGVLGGVVGAAARERQPPAHRGDVDDRARAGLAHPRQHELGEAQETEHVGLELAADRVHRQRLERTRERVARVIDQHVDAPGLGQRRPHRVLAGHVEGEGPAARRLELVERRRLARGGEDRPPAARQP
jgi:hypothetical protein